MVQLTGRDVRRLRERNDWSLQDLANFSGINKAYLSEFENGKRQLDEAARAHLVAVLEGAAGTTTPTIERVDGVLRLVLKDGQGNRIDIPAIAHVKWVDASGTGYSMYLGER